jgi:hypothetical protein
MAKNKRGPTTKQELVEEIISIKRGDKGSQFTADTIIDELKRRHKNMKSFPKARTIYNIIKKNKDRITFDPQNGIWSIGVCEKYKIPYDSIPTLIKEQHLRETTNLGPGDLTIREAIWLLRLYPLIMPILKKLFSKEKEDPLIWHSMVSLASRQYSFKEQLAEVSEDSYIDTSDLDYIFFINEDRNVWQTLREQSKNMLNEDRDVAFKKNNRVSLDSFITYSEV